VSRQSEAIKSSPKGAGRPVGSNRQASLARILPAARKLFAENGYTKTTLKDVGKEAGMTHAALYSYFPSKAALYEATCEDAQAILLAEYTEAIALGTTLRDQLGQILRAGAQAHDRDSSITGLLGAIPLEIRRHPELAELLLDRQNLTLQFLSGAFRQAQQRGEINSSASPEEQVVVIMGAAVGIALLQHGLEHTSLVHSMEIFIELIEARLFITTN
jgi:AcrR family transcriptional regulator